MSPRVRFTFLAVLLCAPLFRLAPANAGGDSGYNPHAWAPAPPQTFYYFCRAGNAGSFHTLYITGIHSLHYTPEVAASNWASVNIAWTQAIHSQKYPYDAHCLFEQQPRIQTVRSQVLAQPHAKTVNINWQYGQSGPATVSSADEPPASNPPGVNTAAANPPAASDTANAPNPAFDAAAQALNGAANAHGNGQLGQAAQTLLNNLLQH